MSNPLGHTCDSGGWVDRSDICEACRRTGEIPAPNPSSPIEQLREVLGRTQTVITLGVDNPSHTRFQVDGQPLLARISAIVVESLGKDDKPISNIHDFSFQEAANEGRNELRAELRQQWSSPQGGRE